MRYLLWLFLLGTLVTIRTFSFYVNQNKDPVYEQPFAEVQILRRQPKYRAGKQILKIGDYTVVTSTLESYVLGDKLRIIGKLDDQGWLWYPTIQKRGRSADWLIQLLRFRQRLERQITHYLPEPQASLLKGVLLGIDDLPPRFRDHLRTSGLIHLVVASGTNVSIVAGFFLSLAGYLSRRQTVILALLAVIIYSLMTGLEPPIVRASLMAGLSFLAELTGRRTWSGWVLMIASALMILISPAYLTSLSFQLSFLATAGVVFLTKPFQNQLEFLPLPKLVKAAVATTLAAQAMVTPRLISVFGQLSLVSPLSNALVLALIEPLMVAGAGLSLLSLVAPEGILRFGYLLSWSPLTLIVVITRWFGSLSWAMISLPQPLFWLFTPWYLGLIRWKIRQSYLS